jgi:hypothetical protein
MALLLGLIAAKPEIIHVEAPGVRGASEPFGPSRRQGKCQDAYGLLAPVYEWFTEVFDTADLREAKTLLAELLI